MHPFLSSVALRLFALLAVIWVSLPVISFAGTPSPGVPQVQRVRALPRQHTDEGRAHTMTPEKLAKLSLIFGTVSLLGLLVFPPLIVFSAIPGVIFSIMALTRMDLHDPASRRNKRLAIFGLVVNGASLLILIGLIYLVVYLLMIA